MNRVVTFLIEDGLAWLGIVGLISFISFVTVAKVVLGSIIGVVGAFIPIPLSRRQDGRGELTGFGFKAAVSGTIRTGVVLIGIMIVGYGFLDGYNAYEDAATNRDILVSRNKAYLDCFKTKKVQDGLRCEGILHPFRSTDDDPSINLRDY